MLLLSSGRFMQEASLLHSRSHGKSAHTMEEMQAVPLLWMKVASYKHYFVIVEVGEKNIRAHCKLCAGNKTVSHCLVLKTLPLTSKSI